MTGDLPTNEFAEFHLDIDEARRSRAQPKVQVLHEYGRLAILDGTPAAARRGRAEEPGARAPAGARAEIEETGARALAARLSRGFRSRKRARRFDGYAWDLADADLEGAGPVPMSCEAPMLAEPPVDGGIEEAPEPPFAARMTGRIAVGRIYVSGPTAALRITPQQRDRIEADVQEGLSLLASRAPLRDVTFVHHFREVTVDVAGVTAGTDHESFERPWRDATLASLGIATGAAGVRTYTRELRRQLGTNWAYTAFITRYPLKHYAYAMPAPGLKWVVMTTDTGGWGHSFDRIFAHESAHVFGAPDEYGSCSCAGSHGHFGRPNSNCEACAPGGGVGCLMGRNVQGMCTETLYHLGYNGLPPLQGPVA
jgi:hypothetical protein